MLGNENSDTQTKVADYEDIKPVTIFIDTNNTTHGKEHFVIAVPHTAV